MKQAYILTGYVRFFLIMSCLFMPVMVRGQITQKTNVLIVNSYHKEFQWTDAQTTAVREVLVGAIDDLELYVEYMDTKRIFSDEYLDTLLQIFKQKYSHIKLDVIITTDDNALRFVMKHHKEVFGHAPVSFCGINDYQESMLAGREMFTGLIEVLDIKATIDLAKKLHPSFDKVFVITDNTPTGIGQRRAVAAVAEQHCPDLKFKFLDGRDYSNEQLLQKLSTLPKNSIVLLTVWLRDKNGQYISVDKGGPLLSSAATVPVYGIINMYFGHGIVGGKLLDSSTQGTVAAELALRILKGEKPSHIPVIVESTNPYMFDYNQLQRWAISISDLPKDSVIINQPSSTVKERRRLVAALVFVVIEGLIILVLVITAFKRLRVPFLENIQYTIIALAIGFGLIIWLFDTAMDYLFFYEGYSLPALLLLDVPKHEIYIRFLIIVSFTLFGIIVSALLVKRRQTERILQLRNTAIYNSPNGVIIADHVGTNNNPVLYANPSFEKITGYSLDEIKGHDCRLLQSDDKDQPGLDEVRSAIKNHRSCQVTIRNYHKDGSIFYNELKIVPAKDKYGETTHFIGIISDVTGRLRGEQALKESEKKYRSVVEDQTEFIVRWLPGGIRTFCNDAYCRYYGLSRDQVIGTSFYPLVSDDDRKTVQGLMEDLTVENPVSTEEHRVALPDGSLGWNLWTNRAIFDEQGKLIEYQSVGRDITERKLTEEALHASEEKFRLMFETSPLGMVLCEMNGTFVQANRAYLDIIGYSHEEAVKLSYWDITPRDYDADEGKQLHSMEETGRYGPYEKEYVRKTGWRIPVLLNGMVIKGVNGVERIWSIIEDITERKRAEEEREKLLKTLAVKNEELEGIVYVSSHDLRSPLINIQGYSTELESSCKEAAALADDTGIPKEIARKLSAVLLEDVPDSLKYITTSADSMDMLLTGLLTLSRLGQSALKIEPLDIDALVTEVITSLQFKINASGIDLTVDKLPRCFGDKTQINQVFTNLLDNAIKYLDPDRKGIIHVSGKVAEGMSIYCVEDNGIGIAPQHQKKVFELFHQLEPQKDVAGQGLGLTIVHRIMARHDGDIWLDSEVGKGSCFYVAMPHTESRAVIYYRKEK